MRLKLNLPQDCTCVTNLEEELIKWALHTTGFNFLLASQRLASLIRRGMPGYNDTSPPKSQLTLLHSSFRIFLCIEVLYFCGGMSGKTTYALLDVISGPYASSHIHCRCSFRKGLFLLSPWRQGTCEHVMHLGVMDHATSLWWPINVRSQVSFSLLMCWDV